MKYDKQDGFSLLELLVVISLLAMGVSYLSHSWTVYQQKQQLAQTASNVFSLLQYYQRQAMWFNSVYQFTYQPQRHQLWISTTDSALADSHSYPLPANIQIDLTQPAIIFYGKRNMAQGGTLTMSNKQGQI